MVATDGSGRLGYEHEKHIVHARVVNDLNVGEIEGVFLTPAPSGVMMWRPPYVPSRAILWCTILNHNTLQLHL